MKYVYFLSEFTLPFSVAHLKSRLSHLILEVSRSHTDARLVGLLLCTSDQPVAEAVTYATHN